MTTTNTELLPCPMCSETRIGFGDTKYSAGTVLENGWSQNTFHFVNCPSCGLSNKGVIGHATKDDAAAAWNKRAATAPAPAAVPSGWIAFPKDMTDEMAEAIALTANVCGGIAYDVWVKLMEEGTPVAAPSASPASTEALTETAKRIAWEWHGHLSTNDGYADRNELWEALTDRDKAATLASARAAAQAAPEVVDYSQVIAAARRIVGSKVDPRIGGRLILEADVLALEAALRSAGEGK